MDHSSHESIWSNIVQQSERVPDIAIGADICCIEQDSFETDVSASSQTSRNSSVSGVQPSSTWKQIQKESITEKLEKKEQQSLTEVKQEHDALSSVLNDIERTACGKLNRKYYINWEEESS